MSINATQVYTYAKIFSISHDLVLSARSQNHATNVLKVLQNHLNLHKPRGDT